MLGRADTTKLLRVAADSYLLRLGYACHHELGVVSWGRLRADILAVRLNSDVGIVEVKSSVSDYTSDGKWKSYLDYCNRMWFAFSSDTYEKLKAKGCIEEIKAEGVGVLVLGVDGYMKSKHPTTRRKMSGSNKKLVITRMAWRAAEISKRTNKRVRVFLDEETKAKYAEAKTRTKARPKRRNTRRRRRTRKPSV